MSQNNTIDNGINDDIKALVIARIESLPESIEVSVGGREQLSKYELLEHIRTGDDLGMAIIESQMEFLKSLKDGSLYEQANSHNAA